LLARRPVQFLRQAGADVLQGVVDVVLGDRNAVDLGQNLRIGLGDAGDHKRRAKSQGDSKTAPAKRRVAEEDHENSFGGAVRGGPISEG